MDDLGGKDGRRFVMWFALAGLVAPCIDAVFLLFPRLYPFGTGSAADWVYNIVVNLALWPMAILFLMGTGIAPSPTAAVPGYVVGALMNVVMYAFIGALIWQARRLILRWKRNDPSN